MGTTRLSKLLENLRKAITVRPASQNNIPEKKEVKKETLFEGTEILSKKNADDPYNGMVSLSNSNNSVNSNQILNESKEEVPTINIYQNTVAKSSSSSTSNISVPEKKNDSEKSNISGKELINMANTIKTQSEIYAERLGNRRLKFAYNLDVNSQQTLTEDLSYASLTKNNVKFVGQYRVLNSEGNVVVSSVKDIPNIERKVPIYGIMQTEPDGSKTWLTEKKDNKDGKYYYDYVKVEDSSKELPEGQEYEVISYETVQIPRPQASDGYYYSDDGRKYIVMPNIQNNVYFQNGLKDGEFVLQKATVIEERGEDGVLTGKEYTTWDTTPLQAMDVIQDTLYTEDDALADAQYEESMAALKDKMPEYNRIANKYIDTEKLAEIEAEYIERISNRRLKFAYNLDVNSQQTLTGDLSYASLTGDNSPLGKYRVINADGDVIVSSVKEIPNNIRQTSDGYFYSDDGRKYIIMSDIQNKNYFQNGLRDGSFILQKANFFEERDEDGVLTGKEYTTWDTTPWQAISSINDILYTEDDAMAEAEYEKKLSELKYEAILKYVKENGLK